MSAPTPPLRSWASRLEEILDEATAQLGVHAGFLAVVRHLLANEGGYYTDAQVLLQDIRQHLAQTDAKLDELAAARRAKRGQP